MSKTLPGSNWAKHLSHSEPHVAVVDDEVDYLDDRQHTAADTETQHTANIIWNRMALHLQLLSAIGEHEQLWTTSNSLTFFMLKIR